MILAHSRFIVANDKADEVQMAFRNRPHHVDKADGFVRMEVVCPLEQPNEFWLLTYWQTVEHFESWHRSHAYKDSHAGIPKGLKLVPGSTEIRLLEVIAD